MNQFAIQCLTPAGSGAIAVISAAGPSAWAAVRRLFRPASDKPLPEHPRAGAVWFGKLGDAAGDEVLVSVPVAKPEPSVEIHCHGGPQAVRWLTELLRREGGITAPADSPASVWALLAQARTARAAAILLDQANGAFCRALTQVADALRRRDDSLALSLLGDLQRHARIGSHLVEPWQVVIAGAPNAGKSSLLNALAGFQRSIVAPVPGTTRDVVTTTLAFDGWLVDLSDTAGLRPAHDALESEGIARAKSRIESSDLCLWVIDASATSEDNEESIPHSAIVVLNKCDLPAARDGKDYPGAIRISSLTGAGLAELVERLVGQLTPAAPPPGSAVPYSTETITLVESLLEWIHGGEHERALSALAEFLRDDRDGLTGTLSAAGASRSR